jgi:hypothetical protein
MNAKRTLAVEIMLMSAAAPMAVAERLSRRDWAGPTAQIHSVHGFVATLMSTIQHDVGRASKAMFGGARRVALLDVDILKDKCSTADCLISALAPVLIRGGRVLLILNARRAPRWILRLVTRLEAQSQPPSPAPEPSRQKQSMKKLR